MEEFFFEITYNIRDWIVEIIAPAWGFVSVVTRALSSTILATLLFVVIARNKDLQIPFIGAGSPTVETLHLLYSTEFVGSVFIVGLLVNYAMQRRRDRLQDLNGAIEKAIGLLVRRGSSMELPASADSTEDGLRSRYRSALFNLKQWPTGPRAWKSLERVNRAAEYEERRNLGDELTSALGDIFSLKDGSLDRGFSIRYAWGQLMVVWVFLLCATAWSDAVSGNLPMIVSLLLTIYALNVCIRLIDGQI